MPHTIIDKRFLSAIIVLNRTISKTEEKVHDFLGEAKADRRTV